LALQRLLKEPYRGTGDKYGELTPESAEVAAEEDAA